jgi:phosphoribosylanthranilate isomerase
MFRVKICGITNLKDALDAIACGADALGFVFYKKSARFIEPLEARKIIQKLPPFIQTVGLFVNVSAQEVNLTCKESLVQLAQIHFEATNDFFQALEVPHIKVIRATCKDDVLKYNDEYRFVDAYVQNYGGEGKRVSLSFFENVDTSKIILAGGLNAENIDEVKNLGFYAFDVSSGVEKEKGIKDKAKIKAFISKVKY